jgi:hypothetical protein
MQLQSSDNVQWVQGKTTESLPQEPIKISQETWDAFKEKNASFVQGTTTIPNSNLFNQPQPCPTCGTCPTCGKRALPQYPYYGTIQPTYPLQTPFQPVVTCQSGANFQGGQNI